MLIWQIPIAVSSFPCYYEREFFQYNQLQAIHYKNKPWDLVPSMLGDELFLKSYNFFLTLLHTKKKSLRTTTYQDL